MRLGRTAQMMKIGLSEKLCCCTVLADAGALVGYGISPHIGHPLLPQTVAADLDEAVL